MHKSYIPKMTFDLKYPHYHLAGEDIDDSNSTYIFLIAISITISIAIQRQCRSLFGVIIFNKTFLTIASVVCGTLAVETDLLQTLRISNDKIPFKLIASLYTPLFLLHHFYNIRTKTTGIVVTIVMSVLLVCGGYLGSFIISLLYGDCSRIQGVIVGTILSTTQPEFMIHFLQLNDGFEKVIAFLHNESLICLILTFPLVDYVQHYVSEGLPTLGATLWYFGLGHLLGLFMGWFIAKLTSMIMRHLYLNLEAIFGIIFGSLTFVYVSCTVLSISGFTAGLVFCIVLQNENNVYLDIHEASFKLLTQVVFEIADGSIFFYATSQAMIRAFNKSHLDYYVVCFVVMGCVRALTILLVYLMIERPKPTIATFQHVYLHAIVFPTSTFSLIFAIEFFYLSPEDSNVAFAQAMFNVCMSMFLNNFFGINMVKWTRMGVTSHARTENMARILDEIRVFRNHLIYHKKLDRQLAQVNWNVVTSYAKLTLGYPYPPLRKPIDWDDVSIKDEEDPSHHVCCEVCPNVQTASYSTLYKHTLRDQRKILANLMATVIKRMMKHCFIGEEFEGIFRRVVLLYEAGNFRGVTAMFRDLLKVHRAWKYCKIISNLLAANKKQIVPRKHFYRFFYYIRCSSMYQILNYVVTIAILFPFLVKLIFQNIDTTFDKPAFLCGLIFFIFDMFVNIFAFSVLSFHQGIATYFTSFWELLDFISIIGTIPPCIIVWFPEQESALLTALSYLKYARLMRILHSIPLVLPKFMFSMEYGTELRKIMVYQCLLATNDMINEVLLYCKRWVKEVDDDVLLALTLTLRNNQGELQQLIIDIQRDMPELTSSLKTKKILIAARCAINDYLLKMKIQGHIDNLEFGQLRTLLNNRKTHNQYNIPPTNPTLLFLNNYWISTTAEAGDFLRSKAVLQKWPDEHLLVEAGRRVLGVYILVSGHLVITNHARYRANVDEVKYTEFENNFISPGNSIGEIDLLRGGRYKYTLQCYGECRTYFIDLATVCRAMQLSKHPINGLQSVLWKRKMLSLVIEILMHQSCYKYKDVWAIQKDIQQAFVPDLRCYKEFVFVESIRDIVLIDGRAMDFYSKHVYQAPAYIPRDTKRLVFPKPLYVTVTEDIHYLMGTKLVIIPVEKVLATDVMVYEEAVATMMLHDFSKCPYHVSQTKGKFKVRKPKIDPKTFQLMQHVSAAVVGPETDILDGVRRTLRKRRHARYK